MLLRNGCGGQVGIESGLSIAVAFYSWAWAQHGVVAATARLAGARAIPESLLAGGSSTLGDRSAFLESAFT